MITTIDRYKWLRIDGASYKVAIGDFEGCCPRSVTRHISQVSDEPLDLVLPHPGTAEGGGDAIIAGSEFDGEVDA